MADEQQAYKSRFLPLPVDAYDLGIDLVLPRDALRLYEHVRRFVQRKNFKKGKVVEKRVYADIKQSVLADRIQHNRQWVNKTLGLLEDLGWLKRARIETNPYGQKRYFLGTRSEEHEETFWADKKMEEYRRHICKGEDIKFDDFGDLDFKYRVGLLMKHLKPVLGVDLGRGVSSPQDRGMSSPQDTPCLPRKTSPVFPARHPLSCGEDILNKQASNTQSSKRQVLNISASADASPPASASGSGDLELQKPPPEAWAGDSATTTTDDSSDHDQGSAENAVPDPDPIENLDPAAQRVEYRKWVFSDDDVTEVVDGEGDLVDPLAGPLEGETMNEFEKRLAKAGVDVKVAVENRKRQQAINESKVRAKATDRQRQKNLSGPNLEKYIPKGSVKRMERVWLEAFDEHYPDFTPAKWWTQQGEDKETGRPIMRPGKESNLVSQLIQMHSVEEVEKYLKWAVANWGTIQTRFKNVPAVPAINFLYGFRENLLPEAVLGNERQQVEAQLDAWFAANPNTTKSPPAALLERLKALKERG